MHSKEESIFEEMVLFSGAWGDAKLGNPPWVMADTLYGQVIANTLGLMSSDAEDADTWIVPPAMVASHLAAEA
jgi:hypothetical protein